jgi:Family of unknown function (DUF6515)
MTTMSRLHQKGLWALCASLLLGMAAVAPADPRDHGHDRDDDRDHGPPRSGWVLDDRYHHDHYYPPRGYIAHTLPPAPYVTHWRGTSYYFIEGAWYRPYRSHYVVVAPPIGVVVPVLPRFYTTIWARGVPYYYADDAYYAWRPEQRGYVVVDPPAKEDSVSTAPPADDIYIYPKNGQSPEQQATDRYECHRWAADQTGYDPTQPLGGVEAAQATARRADYHRAMTACLEGRGYSVK